jgi:cytoskeletal protein CcmA (bactofilin family)
VAADIQSTNTTLGGHYTGNVVATGTIELTSTARVEGNLTCRSLIVNQGAIFSGQSIMDSGVKKPAAVPAAAASPAASSSPSSSPPSASSPSSPSSPSR